MITIRNCRVLRPAGMKDCTGYGITARFASLDVVADVPYLMVPGFGGEGRYYDRPDEKAVEEYVRENGLDPRKVLVLCDKRNNPIYTPYLKPLDSVYAHREDPATGRDVKLMGPCAGGNHVVLDDGNGERIIRVHDRYDTPEDWDGLSR